MNEAVDQGRTVLVTGGSGYLGSWVITTLLCQGFRVRTTIRNLSREAEVRTMIGSQVDPGDRLVFFAANLLSDESSRGLSDAGRRISRTGSQHARTGGNAQSARSRRARGCATRRSDFFGCHGLAPDR
jgi:NAD(P)-dependent dehydrogenase (short-subunit alcohol dehydrogenase family)